MFEDRRMTLKKPAHPGERIAHALDELGLSVQIAAKTLGISRQQLHNIIAGRQGISPEMACRLEKGGLGVTARTWLARQADFDLAQIGPRAIKVSPLRRTASRAA